MRRLLYDRRMRCGAALATLVFALGFAGTSSATNPPHVPGSASPNHRLTPGAHFNVGKARICMTGYSASVRKVPESEKNAVYAAYGEKRVPRGYEVDHLVSLELGGSNVIANLWPEHYYDPWGARTKDRLENKLHRLVCSGAISLVTAQRKEAANWIAAYKLYIGASSSSGSTTSPSPPAPAATSASHPAGATAKCNDDTFSYSAHHSGSCPHHGGVLVFYV